MDEHKLIILVENHALLYDKKSKDFKNIIKKREVWAAITKELGCNVNICERRWTTLRERFAKELRIVEPSGSGVGASSEWLHFQSLEFLKTHLQRRRQRSNFKMSEESLPTCFENDDVFSSTPLIYDTFVESPPEFLDNALAPEPVPVASLHLRKNARQTPPRTIICQRQQQRSRIFASP